MMSEHDRQQALTKCIVWFYDGNIRTFYSRDKPYKKAQASQTLGIRRLEKMLYETFKGQWETAIIYQNKPKGRKIARYKQGVRRE